MALPVATVQAPEKVTSPDEVGRVSAFLLVAPGETLVARGQARVITPQADSLAGRVRSFFDREARPGTPEPRMLVGAVPFSPGSAAFLVQPREMERRGARVSVSLGQARPALRVARWRVRSEPSTADYMHAVEQALARMAATAATAVPLRKVVLSRRLVLESDAPIDADALFTRLSADVGVTAFSVPLPSTRGARRTLVGATPELLLAKSNGCIRSEPMAGSARRMAEAGADADVAEALLRSDKDRREHAAVIEWVADRLTPYCRQLRVPKVPVLRSTATMWHLATPVEGDLRDPSASSVELMAALHPTPAVCGTPTAEAAAAIAELEPFDRGFFGGAVGWCDADGDGAWFVTLRCGEIEGATATIHAGAGIVPGSSPASEAAETSAKFTTLLRALGVDEQGKALPGPA